jgi:hypothetical protein
LKLRHLFSTAFLLTFLTLPAQAETLGLPGDWKVIPYGKDTPILTCSPLGACIVALQPSEQIINRFLPDTTGWDVKEGQAGPGGSVPVLAVKPKDCGITSNLIVTTDKRIYAFLLSSPVCEPAGLTTPAAILFDRIAFEYPEEFAVTWNDTAPLPTAAPVRTQATSVAHLNFEYVSRTYVVLRSEDLNKPAPAFFVRSEGGSLEVVNFTEPTAGGRVYTIDRVVPELVLATGNEAADQTVIRRRK